MSPAGVAVLVAGGLVLALVAALEIAAWRERRARRRYRLRGPMILLMLAVCAGPLSAAEGKRDRSWPWLVGAYSAGVAADGWTTQRALDAGAREINPMYSWAGRDGVAPLRLAVGAWTVYRLHVLHRTHPRAARRLTWTLTALSVLVAVNNRHVEHRQLADR